jgi:hypothetical protein
MLSKEVRRFMDRIDSRRLTNNTQRALLALLRSEGEWVSRQSIRVRSATSRIRDLRTNEYGAFDVQCATATELKRPVRGVAQPTFYRLNPRSVTLSRLQRVFEGVVST